jgi:hypothetical protein
LWRETKNEITSNASAESWTSVEGGTGDFGEHTMQARFGAGQVIATQQLDKHENLGYGGAFAKEEEWTVLGGYLARNIPEESKATDYYDEDKDQTPRAD